MQPRELFIAKQSFSTYPSGHWEYSNEAPFLSYEDAIARVHELRAEYDTDPRRGEEAISRLKNHVRFEICRYAWEPSSHGRGATKTWRELYDLDGNLFLRQWYDAEGGVDRTEPEEEPSVYELPFEGKFQIGDIVYIVPQLQYRWSPVVDGTFGVVVETPLIRYQPHAPSEGAVWRDEDEIPAGPWGLRPVVEERLEYNYTVDFVNYRGFWDHYHLAEANLEPAGDRLPEELEILKIYSDHIANRRPLSQRTVNHLHVTYLIKGNIFDFTKREVFHL